MVKTVDQCNRGRQLVRPTDIFEAFQVTAIFVDYLEQNDHHHLPVADPEHLYNDNRQVGFPVSMFFREAQTGEVAKPFSFHGSIRRPSQVTRVRFPNTLASANWET